MSRFYTRTTLMCLDAQQAYSAVIQFGGSDMVERASADQATLACDALTIYPLIGLAVLRLQT